VNGEGYNSISDKWGYHKEGCILGDAKFSWWGGYRGCKCYSGIANSGSSDRTCDMTNDGFEIHDGYYGGEDGTYLIKVPAEKLANEMMKELYMAREQGYNGKKGDLASEQYWVDRKIPPQMRGLWWTDYNNGLTSFLHNQETPTTSFKTLSANDDEVQSTTKVWGQNVWSWDSDTLYKIVKGTHLAYQFNFHKTCPADANTCKQDDEYNWADITPRFEGPGWVVPRWLTHFSMRPATNCRNCAADPNSQPVIIGEDAATAANACQLNTCWRRETALGEEHGTSKWDYDLIKVVDQHGRKIEPHFTNWKNSLTKETGGSALLQRCMPTPGGKNQCAGDTDSSVGAFSWDVEKQADSTSGVWGDSKSDIWG